MRRDPPITPATGEILKLAGRRDAVGQIALSSVPRPVAEKFLEVGAEFRHYIVLAPPRGKVISVVNKLTSKAKEVSIFDLKSERRLDPEWKLKAECIRLYAQLTSAEWAEALPIAVWRNKGLGLRADYMPHAHEVLVMAAFGRSTTLTELFASSTKGLIHEY